MYVINTITNEYFHMIPLWKSPIKLPVELPGSLGLDPRCGAIWSFLLDQPSTWPESRPTIPISNAQIRSGMLFTGKGFNLTEGN